MKKTIIVLLIVLIGLGLYAFERPFYGMRNGGSFYEGASHHPHPQFRGRGEHRFYRRNGFRQHRYGEMGFFFSQLDLTDKQLEKADKLRTDFIGKRIEKTGILRKLQFEKRTAMRNHDFDKAKSLSDKISQIRNELSKNRIDFREKMWNILTNEQKTKADKLLKKGFHRGYYFDEFEDEDNQDK